MKKSLELLKLIESISEAEKHPFKDMIRRNTIGLSRTFLGPFSGLAEPLINAGMNQTRKSKLNITRPMYREAELMNKKGFVVLVKFKDNSKLSYFKNKKDASDYAKRQSLKVEWVGTIENIEVR